MARRAFLALVILSWVAACAQPAPEPTALLLATATLTTAPTYTATVAATPTATASSTVTPAPTETRPPPTSTPTRYATPTLWPTLPFETQEAALSALYRDNAGCALPCWWGISPGQTTWAEALDILAPLTMRMAMTFSPSLDVGSVEFAIDPPDEVTIDKRVWQYYGGSFETVLHIEIGTLHSVPRFEMAEVLTTYGAPNEVRVNGVRYTPEGPQFDVELVYLDKGIYVRYWVQRAVEVGDNIRLCAPLWIPGRALLLEPGAASSYADVISHFGNQPEHEAKLLGEAANGLTVAEFYETFRRAGTKRCFDTPAAIWPDV